MAYENKTYISGPTSGYDPEERRAVFDYVETKLRMSGDEVYNPLDNGLPEDADCYEHMRANIRALTDCDAVLFLPGWEKSAECRAVFGIAACIGAEMFFNFNVILDHEQHDTGCMQ